MTHFLKDIVRQPAELQRAFEFLSARASGAKVIGITNAPDGTLAREAHFPIVVPVKLDHAISVNTYTTLALATGILAARVVEGILQATSEAETEKNFLQGLTPSESG